MINYHFPAWTAEDGSGLTDREALVFGTVNQIIERYVYRLPVDVLAICRACGIAVRPLSWYTQQGMDPEALFTIWGNTDGVAATCEGRSVINYNDQTPHNRARFTLSEELMHILLGHTSDPRFCIFSQDFDPVVYEQYEREAKTAAGMLLFPASLYLRHRLTASDAAFAHVCDISEACAWTTRRFYEARLLEMKKFASQKVVQYDRTPLTAAPKRPVDVWQGEEEYRRL